MFPAISGRCLAPESSRDSHGDSLDLPFEVFADSVLEGSLIDRFRAIAHRFASRPAWSVVLAPMINIESLSGDSLQAMDIQAELERQFRRCHP